MCVAQIFRVPFHVNSISCCVFFIQVSFLSNTIYSTHDHRYAFIRNMQCGSGITITVYTYNKKTNAGDLVNSVCTLAQPAAKYAIKTAAW